LRTQRKYSWEQRQEEKIEKPRRFFLFFSELCAILEKAGARGAAQLFAKIKR
jgi:hypothetical protein